MADRRRARNGNRWRKVRARVLAEMPYCNYCGIWLDTSLPPDHPHAAQVDHVIPVRIAPEREYDLTNLVSACRTCNRAKSDKLFPPAQPPPTPRQLNTSRDW